MIYSPHHFNGEDAKEQLKSGGREKQAVDLLAGVALSRLWPLQISCLETAAAALHVFRITQLI
jgi:hypothetical protein